MITLVLELKVTVMDDSQAERLMTAIETGEAENILKRELLYNAEGSTDNKRARPSTSVVSTPLVPVETKKKGGIQIPSAPEPGKRERPMGIKGRTRLKRNG